MSINISKHDWKLFQEKLPSWQERYMESLITKYIKILSDEGKPASERFHELEQRIKEDRRKPGVCMELSKSEMIFDIQRLMTDGVITGKDLSEFSEDIQNYLWG